jgi:predicted dienelactone hydrolase
MAAPALLRTARTLATGAALVLAALAVLLLQAAVALLAMPAPTAAGPGPVTAAADAPAYAVPGPHPVGVRRFTSDEAPRPLTVWYPAAPVPADRTTVRYAYGVAMFGAGTSVALATYPGRSVPGAAPDLEHGAYSLVVLSPGFALSTSSYGWLAEHLASYGLVVVAVQHQESLDPRNLWRATAERPRDVTSVLDLLEDPGADLGLDGLVDPDRVAVVGHSYGGSTALAAGGAQLDPVALAAACREAGSPGEPLAFLCDALEPRVRDLAALVGADPTSARMWPSLGDSRVDAVAALAGDAVMFGPRGLARITVPLLAIGGTADADSPFRWGTEAAYTHASGDHRAEVGLVGAEHLLFAGGCDAPRLVLRLVPTGFCSDPAWPRQRAHALIAHHTTAFLLAELDDDPRATRELGSRAAAPPGTTYRSVGY